MSIERIDIENRVELATQELVKAAAGVIALVTAARVYVQRDTSHAVDYPCVTIQAIGFHEFGLWTGWYKGGVQLAAMTYRKDDLSQSVLKTVAGELRGWAQQTDLPTQYNATAIAKATATALDVRDVRLDGMAFDNTEENIQEFIVPVAILCRPTQAVTT
jgi:hypothetical protein